MAIAVEGYSVIAIQARIEEKYSGGIEALSSKVPNATELRDDELWQCSFMAMADAESFLLEIQKGGMDNEKGANPDLVIVNEFDGSVTPYCEWLQVRPWEKGRIAWFEGSNPDTVVARKGWSPETGSGLQFAEAKSMEDLEFLRMEDNIEVYKDKETGEEVYIGRSGTSPDTIFKAAGGIITNNMINPGQAPLSGDVAEQVLQAVKDLEGILKEVPDSWRVHWCVGKGRQSLGDTQGSYEAFKRAWELEQENEAVPRELAGACLELGKAQEAVEIGQKAAALHPDDPESLGNLACAYLFAAMLPQAEKTVNAALKLAPEDPINLHIQQTIKDVQSGTTPQPSKLADLTYAKKKSLWDKLKFWK
ncbi:MAG: hypothetical protein P1V97_06070 [Planctomycetota bacterium]|nr:hypothetical protein [Planctomycetota bacterium]